jgi:hypothetical protein
MPFVCEIKCEPLTLFTVNTIIGQHPCEAMKAGTLRFAELRPPVPLRVPSIAQAKGYG